MLMGGGDMTKEMQDAILNRFREGKHKVLITTDVLSRGIDVPNVGMVVCPHGVAYCPSNFFCNSLTDCFRAWPDRHR